MANVMGVPRALASSARDLSALGSSFTFPRSAAFRVTDWPFRLRIQGATMGLRGDPPSPSVEAIGMPRSMCVA